MYRRLPSLRQPRTFYDVFGVVIGGVFLVGGLLSIWHDTIIRIEMAVFSGLLFLWAAWAIYHLLEQYPKQTGLFGTK